VSGSPEDDNNILQWKAVIVGPKTTPYEVNLHTVFQWKAFIVDPKITPYEVKTIVICIFKLIVNMIRTNVIKGQ
jgi:ubiquitin-protein ligase